MSTALAMVLAAGMVVGDGPGKVPGEAEQKLDLRGEWKGIWKSSVGCTWNVYLSDEWFFAMFPEDQDRFAQIPRMPFFDVCLLTIADKGRHRVRGEMGGDKFHGSYRQEKDDLVIRFYADNSAGSNRLWNGGSNLLVLHRVKPAK